MNSEHLELFLEIEEQEKAPKRIPFEWPQIINGQVKAKKNCIGFFIPEEMAVRDFNNKVMFKLNEHMKKNHGI